MNGITQTSGGFDKVIFESVIDTYAGGVGIDPSGYTNADNIIPAGSIISKPDATTGLSKVIAATEATPANVLGFSHATVALDANPLVSVVIEGVVRKAAVPLTDAQVAVFAPLLPKISFV